MISSASSLPAFRKTLVLGVGVLFLHSFTSPFALAMWGEDGVDNTGRSAGIKRKDTEAGEERGKSSDKKPRQGEAGYRADEEMKESTILEETGRGGASGGGSALPLPCEEGAGGGSPGEGKRGSLSPARQITEAKTSRALRIIKQHGRTLSELKTKELPADELLVVANYLRHQFGNSEDLRSAEEIFAHIIGMAAVSPMDKVQAYRGLGKLYDRGGSWKRRRAL